MSSTATTSNNDDRLLRVGILGCASIAKKNAIAILQESSGCCVTAVASRTLEKANAFVHDFLAPRVLKSAAAEIVCLGGSSAYDDLVQSSVVDAVYIPLPTTLHKEWVLKALQAGKHVLLEKPVAVSAEEFQEMIEAAKVHHKYLQDGTMFVHHPRTRDFIQTVNDTSVMGNLDNLRMEAGFSFCGDDGFFQNNVRVRKDCDLFGCLGDLAWYVLRMALLVVVGGQQDGQTGVNTSAQVVDYKLNDDGVPIDATMLVKFKEVHKTLSFHCGFQTQFRQYLHIAGTKRWAFMDDFVLPKAHPVNFKVQSMSLTEFDLVTEHPTETKEFEGPVQEVLMWQTFARLSRAIDNTPQGWAGDTNECQEARTLSQTSCATQHLLDALMASIRGGGSKVMLCLMLPGFAASSNDSSEQW